MIKTLFAFTFAIGLMFVGNMDAQAYSSFSTGGGAAGAADTDSTPDRLPENATHAGQDFDTCAGSCHSFTTDQASEESCGTGGLCHPTKTVVNTAPVAEDDSVTTNVNTPVDGDVSTNDTDTASDTLTFAVDTQPTNGNVVLNNDGTFTYTPATDYVGSDSFTYTVTDAGGLSDTGTVNITVSDVPLVDTDGDGLTDDVDPDANNPDTDGDSILDGHDDDNTVAAVGTIIDGGKIMLHHGTATGTIDDVDSTMSIPTVTVQGKYGTVEISGTSWTYTLDNTIKVSEETTDYFTIQYWSTTTDSLVSMKYSVDVPANVDDPAPIDPVDPIKPVEPVEPVVPTESGKGNEETEVESTNPETGGTAGLMISLAATTGAGAGMVVFRKRK